MHFAVLLEIIKKSQDTFLKSGFLLYYIAPIFDLLMTNFKPLIRKLQKPERHCGLPGLAVQLHLAGSCSVALYLKIGAAPMVAGMFCGRMQVLRYEHIQELSVLTVCWM